MKYVTINLLSLLIIYNYTGTNASQMCGDWLEYKDEKCFKLFEKMTSHDEAVESCKFAKTGDNDPVPTLVSIDTLDEQEFLNKNIFNQPGIVDSIWIGAKRGNLSTFVWDDGTGIDYDNWAEHMPSNDSDKACVEIKPNSGLGELSEATGEWYDVGCSKKNLVLCEKLQSWPLLHLQTLILKYRDELRLTQINLTSTLNELIETRELLNGTSGLLNKTVDRLEQKSLELKSLEQKVDLIDEDAHNYKNQTDKEIADLQANTVPINFIYVQLGGQKRPQELWPMYKWAEITSNYHGRFFRAEYAGLSEPFGYAQGASTKRLVSVTQENCHYEQSDYESIELIPGKESIYLLTGQRIKKDNTGLQFKISDDEIKPDNEAIRIFQRIP